MKKLMCLVLVLCLVCGMGIVFTGCTPRSEKLIISNWEYYMPEEVYKGFEKWYKNETGNTVKVVYEGMEFESNEGLYTQLTVGKEDFDLVCPSDYMVQRMIKEDILEELDEDTLDALKLIDPVVLDYAKAYDPTNKYAMPYIWGTVGILFNSKSEGQTMESMSSWDVLWDTQYKEQVYMKDSPKDIYTVAMLYEEGDRLLADLNEYGADSTQYQNRLNAIFNNATTETITTAKAHLKKQKDDGIIYVYDDENGKMEILSDRKPEYERFGMFWSCDAGYIMNGDVNAGANKDVRFVVPEEGSNVWADNFVIPKNAVNKDAANKFIQYLCQTDIAYACMDYVGSATAVKAAAAQYEEELRADAESGAGFFEGTAQEFRTMYIDMLFPPEAVLKRCAMMKDFGALNDALNDMLIEVKAYKPR